MRAYHIVSSCVTHEPAFRSEPCCKTRRRVQAEGPRLNKQNQHLGLNPTVERTSPRILETRNGSPGGRQVCSVALVPRQSALVLIWAIGLRRSSTEPPAIRFRVSLLTLRYLETSVRRRPSVQRPAGRPTQVCLLGLDRVGVCDFDCALDPTKS